MLDAAMRRHRGQPDGLLAILRRAQEVFGFLADDVALYVSQALQLPLARVYGAATSQASLSLGPQTAHTCTVCVGTACQVKGGDEILEALEADQGVKEGQPTPDGALHLASARCVGACAIAPAVAFDTDVTGRHTVETVLDRVRGWRKP
jgi:bidirectional [NiFe] hydrogenase diaphorase subunit